MKKSPAFRLTVLAAAMFCSQVPQAGELWFPPELVTGTGDGVDLSRFENGQQLPGVYTVAVYLNRELLYSRDVTFFAADTDAKRAGITDDTGLMAGLTQADFIDAGVRPEAFGERAEDGAGQYLSPGSVIEQATTHFDFQAMRLDISVPHKWVHKRPRNWTSPALWDDGITAGLLNWSFSGSESQGRSGSGHSRYLSLNSGFNAGPWRLRDERTLTDNSHRREWHHGRTWLERGIKDWRSTLVMGDTTTEGGMFDSIQLRGVSLGTDDGMYPDQERGYAPVIRGVAVSNARVSIRQNGYVMYETNVAPGEFAIDDISPMYSSGDLEVTVTEADGGIRVFTVPYATVPNLLREGRTKYAFSAGQLQNHGRQDKAHPVVLQGNLTRGLPYGITAFTGGQYSRKYQSVLLGSGINMGALGAFSADITHANSTLADGSRHRGQSVRFLYSRGFASTGTTFQLAGYRYSTRGFYTLEESYRAQMTGWQSEEQRDVNGCLLPRPVGDWYDLRDNRRERMDVSVSQNVGDRSSLYLTGSRQTYWHGQGASTSLQAGFSSALGPVSYSLNYSESYGASAGRTDRNLSLSLSLPLESLLGERGKSMYASYGAGRDGQGRISHQASLGGTALEQSNLSWHVSQSRSGLGEDSSNLHLGYQGGYGDISAGYSQGQGYRQASYDMRGGVVLHSDGLTAGQPLGNTSVLVSVPGAAGIPLEGGAGVRTDWRGYAVQPWASEYHENRVALDVAHMDTQTEVDEPVARVIPTKGAIVRAGFAAKSGLRVLMTLMKDGKPLPFGTTVSAGDSTGITGDDGQVFLTGLARSGTVMAKWGDGAAQTCQADWHIGEADPVTPLARVTAVCR
ncbi:fimbria/pilus outer membrane usher protein [Serratia marcescens]|uniref:fimbria/pilus outer membrane usher protein n=1 Tax=Serratia marcescens TaxID=615 RepID=UPI001EF7FEB2|nr:fimbria/pilus outer membrane usher protein [Serratia marcescens]